MLNGRGVDDKDHVISLPSASVTWVVTGILAHDSSTRLASSKSDGRIPRTTSRPKYAPISGLVCTTSSAMASLYPAKLTAAPPSSLDQLGGDDVHRGRADEAADEEVDGAVEQVLRCVDLLQHAGASTQTRSPSVMASTWSWVT